MECREPYQELERAFGEWLLIENVVACSSGTAALHLALESLRLLAGSLVIVPEFTMIACARAVTLAGLEPVFVDCDESLQLNLDLVDQALSRHECRAIMAVHVYGRCCNMEALHSLAAKHGIPVIEDMAEAHGVRPHRQTEVAAWSFYKNKIISGEEGGACAFRDPAKAAHASQLRSLGFMVEHDFWHVPRGHNYRLANRLAEPILDSLCRVSGNQFLRRQIETTYDRWCPVEWRMPPREVVWVYDFRVPPAIQDTLVRRLNEEGIAARHGFKPMSGQEEYRGCHAVLDGRAARMARLVIYLPVQPGVTTEGEIIRAFDVAKIVAGWNG